MDGRHGVYLIGSQNQSLVFPVIEVLGRVAAYTAEHAIGTQQRIGLVFAIPIIGAVGLTNLEAMGLDGLAVGVEPYLAGADGIIGNRMHGYLLNIQVLGGNALLLYLQGLLLSYIIYPEDADLLTAVNEERIVCRLDANILHGKACSILQESHLVAFHLGIAEEYVLDRALGLTDVVDEFLTALNDYVMNRNVVEVGGILVDLRRILTVREALSQVATPLDAAQHVAEHGIVEYICTDTLDKEVLHATATRTQRLDTEGLVGAVEHAVVTVDVLHIACHLRAADYTTGTTQCQTIAHNDTVGRTIHPYTIDTTARLHRETIILTVEGAVFYQGILGRLDIHAISTTVTKTVDRHTTNDDTVAVLGHNIPIEALFQGNTFHQYVFTVNRSNGLGKEDFLVVLHTIVDTLFQGLLTILGDKLNVKCLFLIILEDFAIGRSTDELATSRQGNVVGLAGIDAGTQRIDLNAFITGKDNGQVVADESAEVQLGTVAEVQIDIRLQLNAPRFPLPGRKYHRTATGSRQLVDGRLDGLAVLGGILILGADTFLQLECLLASLKLTMVYGGQLKLEGSLDRSYLLWHCLRPYLTADRNMLPCRNLRHARCRKHEHSAAKYLF